MLRFLLAPLVSLHNSLARKKLRPELSMTMEYVLMHPSKRRQLLEEIVELLKV